MDAVVELPLVKRLIPLESVEGVPYRAWEWCRMPRIQDKHLKCSIYLYPSVAAAKSGQALGGSGFLYRIPSAVEGKVHLYAVTNSHVVQGGSAVIRLNRRDGNTATITTSAAAWTYSETADLAVFPLELDESIYDYYAVKSEMLMTKPKVVTKGLGVGDETFVVGRFINHEGRQSNRPTVRFGEISMMPDPNDGVYNRHMSQKQEAYLVETHTVCGYSGSPVFFYIPAFSLRPQSDAANNPTAWRGPWLLGIDWAHLINEEPILKDGNKTGMTVEVTTGMMCVTPAWKLQELLADRDLAKQRESAEAEWTEKTPNKVVARLDSVSSVAGDALLKALCNTPPSPRKAKAKKKTG